MVTSHRELVTQPLFRLDRLVERFIVGLQYITIQYNTLYTGMDKTSLVHQLWEFICEGLCPRHVERNYVPLFGVQTAWHSRTSTYVITLYVT